ncbi:MAG: endonuclease/exonuclease/phosphatase family protein [Actinoplanes sp.]
MGLSLASLNLHCGLDRHGTPYEVTAAVRAPAADVVLVQENWRPRGEESLARRAARALGYDGIAELDLVADTPLAALNVIRGSVPAETGAFGLAVLSRLPWREYTTIALGAAPGDVTGARFAQVAEIPLGLGGVLRVVNTHLTHRLPYGPRQLRRLISGLGDGGPPTVIGGDLNMCRPTVHLAAPYRPVLRGRTWPAHRPVAQIDHLLAGPGVGVVAPRVVAEVGSDHRPIRAFVALTRSLALRLMVSSG